MVQAVQVFKTTDGEVFESEHEATVHEVEIQNKARIEAFVNKHFPIPEPEVVVGEDGQPVIGEDGQPLKKAKSNQGRGPARKAIALWIAENA